MDKKIIQKADKYFTEEEKHNIIQELISTQCTKVEIFLKKPIGKRSETECRPCRLVEHIFAIRWARDLKLQILFW